MTESQDWSLLERTQECLQEHMKEIHHLRKKLSELRGWQSLTDEEIASIFTGKDATWWKPFARAIEAALKEKNK